MPQTRNLSGCQVFDAADLPPDWECAPLEDRIELAYGSGLREEDRKSGNIDVYGSNGRVGSHDIALVNEPGILIGRKGTIGAVHYAPRAFWAIDTVYYVVPKKEDNLHFLHHLLDFLPLDFLNAATGVPGLSRRDAYALRGVFPSPREQADIARVLDAADTVLERTRATIEHAKQMRLALSQRLFSHGLRGERQKKTVIGLIPRSWDVLPASAVVPSFQYGLSVPMDAKGTTPILRMGNIQDGGVLLDGLKYVTLPNKLLSPYLLHRGDVLFNRTNSQEWVGKVGVYRHDAEAVFASYLIRLLPDITEVDPYFLGHVLNSYQAQCRIKRYATPGVQQVNINATNLGKVLIPVPRGSTALQEQRDIVTVLEAADAVVRSHQPILASQEALKKSLRHDLLTGRVRLSTRTKAAVS